MAATIATAVVAKKKKKEKPVTHSLVKITDSIFACPFPDDIDDWDAFYRYSPLILSFHLNIFRIRT